MTSRRNFMKGALAGGFVLGFHVPANGANEPEQFAPNAFIRIDRSGQTTLVMPQVEMGQGIYTSIAMILAEELDADFSKVALQHAPPNEKLYANPAFGIQATGGSTSIRAFWLPLRKAAAAARAMMIQAAAQTWGVGAVSVRADNSAVIHEASGRRFPTRHSSAGRKNSLRQKTPRSRIRASSNSSGGRSSVSTTPAKSTAIPCMASMPSCRE